MPASETAIATASASRYLQQLCKHWSHKFAVQFTPQHGTDCTLECPTGSGKRLNRSEAAGWRLLRRPSLCRLRRTRADGDNTLQ